MRTTVEIPDRQRARLLEIATRRGEKGFSKVIQEAIALFLRAQDEREDRVREALSAIGSFDDEAAESLTASVREIRERWR